MKKSLKNYKSTLILLGAIILGAIVGIIWREKAAILSPFGDIFINLMFVVIVPLIFTTITTSIIKSDNVKRLGKIIFRIMVIFLILSIVSALIGVFVSYNTKLVNVGDETSIMELMKNDSELDTSVPILEKTLSLITVSDFNYLLSKSNIIALFVFSIIFGLAVRKSKEKGKEVAKFIESLNDITLNVINIIMYYAPIGLGCYFASLIGTYGNYIATGFLKTFLIYTITCLFIYIFVYSAYAFIAGGKRGLKAYWKNIFPPTMTALATCSSAASIPINIMASKNIGVPNDIAEVTIPMGTNFHKDGSVVGSVFKIMFLVYLFNIDSNILTIIGVSIVATLLVSAIPVGGGTISEMMILSLMGFPAAALPLLTIIATIIDAPATVLNVVGDTTSSMLAARWIDGKSWMKKR